MGEECDRKKYKGKVRINGKIFLDQFFSLGGRSDADTVRVYLNPSSVEFRKSEEDDWQRNLTLFDNAYYYDDEDGKWKKIVVRDRGHNEQEYIKIRLQGIDAPELHCLANVGGLHLEYNHFTNFKSLNAMFEYRQHWGARAAAELATHLKSTSTTENGEEFVEGYAISQVNTPHDLFDKFGRAVADIVTIKKNSVEENLNQWLVKEGWAFPDYYDSMSNEEIETLMKQDTKSEGIRSNYTKELVPFDFNLFYRRDDDIQSDKGPVNLPKFFRKQIDYEALKKSGFKKDPKAKFELTTLKKYIEYRKNKCYKLEEFLKERHCAKEYALSEFIDETGYMQVEPGSLVNIESDSKIESINAIDRWY